MATAEGGDMIELILRWICEIGWFQTLILMVIGVQAVAITGIRQRDWDVEGVFLWTILVMWILALIIVGWGHGNCPGWE